MAGWYELKQTKNDQYYFSLKAGNGETILHSELYVAKSSASNGIASMQKNSLRDERYKKLTSSNGKFYFTLVAGNHEVIGQSEMYNSEAARDNGIESVKTNGPTTQIKDVTVARIQEVQGNDEKGHLELPRVENIATLPRWARVAFAARCVRRMQPLLEYDSPDVPQIVRDSVDHAIKFAESLAANAHCAKKNKYSTSLPLTHDVAHALNYAARLTAQLTVGADAPADTVASAVHAAYAVADTTSTTWFVPLLRAIWFDFELLQAVVEKEHWTDETPVPPEFFGPIWPDGVPKDWPKDADKELSESALRLQFSIPSEMDREQADRIIQDIMIAANELHLAYGGSGLRLADEVGVYEPALVAVGGGE